MLLFASCPIFGGCKIDGFDVEYSIHLYPPVAKLDIAADSDSEGRGFKSLRADHNALTKKMHTQETRIVSGFLAVYSPIIATSISRMKKRHFRLLVGEPCVIAAFTKFYT